MDGCGIRDHALQIFDDARSARCLQVLYLLPVRAVSSHSAIHWLLHDSHWSSSASDDWLGGGWVTARIVVSTAQAGRHPSIHPSPEWIHSSPLTQ